MHADRGLWIWDPHCCVNLHSFLTTYETYVYDLMVSTKQEVNWKFSLFEIKSYKTIWYIVSYNKLDCIKLYDADTLKAKLGVE